MKLITDDNLAVAILIPISSNTNDIKLGLETFCFTVPVKLTIILQGSVRNNRNIMFTKLDEKVGYC